MLDYISSPWSPDQMRTSASIKLMSQVISKGVTTRDRRGTGDQNRLLCYHFQGLPAQQALPGPNRREVRVRFQSEAQQIP